MIVIHLDCFLEVQRSIFELFRGIFKLVSRANFLKIINTRTSKRNDNDTTEEISDEVFHDSFKDLNITKEEQEEITLEMIYKEIKMFKQDFSSKIDSVKEDILLKLQKENAALKTEISEMKDDLIEKARIIDELQESIDKTQEDKADHMAFCEVERDTAELQQYTRRNNIEISGLPETIEDKSLEDTVIKIAKVVDISIAKNDIEACHRLRRRKKDNGPRRIIVRFVNRKIAEKFMRKGNELRKPYIFEKADLTEKIYINNNLCSYYRYLWGKVKSLYQKQLLILFGYLMAPLT